MTQEELNEIRDLVREIIRTEIRLIMNEMRREIRDSGAPPIQRYGSGS